LRFASSPRLAADPVKRSIVDCQDYGRARSDPARARHRRSCPTGRCRTPSWPRRQTEHDALLRALADSAWACMVAVVLMGVEATAQLAWWC
jgi:hypothetical protein